MFRRMTIGHWIVVFFILTLICVAALLSTKESAPTLSDNSESSVILMRGNNSNGQTITGIGFVAKIDNITKLCTIRHIAILENLQFASDIVLTGSFEPLPGISEWESIQCASASTSRQALTIAYNILTTSERTWVETTTSTTTITAMGYAVKTLSDSTGDHITENTVMIGKGDQFLVPGTSGSPLLQNNTVVGVLVGGNKTEGLNYFIMLKYP